MRLRHTGGRARIAGIVAAIAAVGALSSAMLPAPVAGQSLSQGDRLWLQCKACHTIDKGAAHRLGPNLHGIVGDRAGKRAGFNYSNALKNSGIVWNERTLDRWIERPANVLKGHRMIYIGMRDADDRKALIAYLKRKGD